MVRILLASILLIVSSSCSNLIKPTEIQQRSYVRGGMCIPRASFEGRARTPGDLVLYEGYVKGDMAVPVIDWKNSVDSPGMIYFVKNSIRPLCPKICTYTATGPKLAVSTLVDFINANCLGGSADCRVSVSSSSNKTIELSASCPYAVVIEVRKPTWSMGSGISVTLTPGGSIDLADPTQSSFQGPYTVIP